MPSRLLRSGLHVAHDVLMAAISLPIALFLRWGFDFLRFSSDYLFYAIPIFSLVFSCFALQMR
ncbi:MAG: hypothetical protein K2Q12_01055, partial [Rickettsiales bacterium]|nr:hypothetical protein [Rickettsiales bacterium]